VTYLPVNKLAFFIQILNTSCFWQFFRFVVALIRGFDGRSSFAVCQGNGGLTIFSNHQILIRGRRLGPYNSSPKDTHLPHFFLKESTGKTIGRLYGSPWGFAVLPFYNQIRVSGNVFTKKKPSVNVSYLTKSGSTTKFK